MEIQIELTYKGNNNYPYVTINGKRVGKYGWQWVRKNAKKWYLTADYNITEWERIKTYTAHVDDVDKLQGYLR